MNLNNSYLTNVYPLSDIIVYDGETGDVIINIDRVTISLSIEEFALISREFEKASSSMNEILMKTVHHIKKDQEIN